MCDEYSVSGQSAAKGRFLTLPPAGESVSLSFFGGEGWGEEAVTPGSCSRLRLRSRLHFPPPFLAPLADRDLPDHLSRFVPLNPRVNTDPSPRPSPLPLRRRDSAASPKERGGNAPAAKCRVSVGVSLLLALASSSAAEPPLPDEALAALGITSSLRSVVSEVPSATWEKVKRGDAPDSRLVALPSGREVTLRISLL